MRTIDIDRSRAPEAGEIRPFTFPSIERFALGNGVPVIFARTEGLPVATLSLLLPSGATREDPTKAGLAKLTASLLESGTEDLTAADVAQRLEGLGVRLHSGTSWEISHVDFTALSEKLDEAGALMARLVRHPVFPEAEVERLRSEQLAGILQRRAEPRGFANELVSRFLFADSSPFSRPLGGTAATAGALARADVVDFHQRTYSPSSAALVAAGNVDRQRLTELLESAFGDWSGPKPPTPDWNVEIRYEKPRVIIVDRPGAVQSEIRVTHLGVERHTPDYFAILVMNTILGGAFSSRLNLNLRERHGFTYGVRSSFVMRRRPGPFLVSTAVQTEVTAAAVREIFAELDRMRTGSVTDEELGDARQYVAGTFPLLLQTTDGIASHLAELIIYDLPDSYLEEFADRVLTIGRDDVNRVADRHLHPGSALTIVLGDAQRVQAELEQLGIGEVEVVQPDAIP